MNPEAYPMHLPCVRRVPGREPRGVEAVRRVRGPAQVQRAQAARAGGPGVAITLTFGVFRPGLGIECCGQFSHFWGVSGLPKRSAKPVERGNREARASASTAGRSCLLVVVRPSDTLRGKAGGGQGMHPGVDVWLRQCTETRADSAGSVTGRVASNCV